jgi:nucleoside phosphorylase
MLGRSGTNESALATADAIERWSPRFIFFMGVAGGLKNTNKGDVVIADVLHGYEYGKIEERFVPRGNWTYKTDIGLLNGAVAHSAADWKVLIQVEPPVECRIKVSSGEIALGDKVVDDPGNQFFAEVIDAWPKIKAVEMEGAGAGNAIEHAQSLGKSVSFMMIRGISDLPRPPEPRQGEDKPRGTEERDVWKAYAADTAAAFTISFIANGLPLPPR